MKQFLIILLVFSATNLFAQKKTDFSGNYLINKEKTIFNGAPEGVLPVSFKIFETNEKITISRTSVNGKESMEMLMFDGSEFDWVLNGGKVKSKLKWNDNGQVFSLNREAFNAEGETTTKVIETWVLEESGKLLKLTKNVDQENGMKYTVVGYFNKQ